MRRRLRVRLPLESLSNRRRRGSTGGENALSLALEPIFNEGPCLFHALRTSFRSALLSQLSQTNHPPLSSGAPSYRSRAAVFYRFLAYSLSLLSPSRQSEQYGHTSMSGLDAVLDRLTARFLARSQRLPERIHPRSGFRQQGGVLVPTPLLRRWGSERKL